MGTFAEKLPDVLADPQGHFHGPMAHAFACGAQMAVTNGGLWNTIPRSCQCCDANDEREKLRESWGVNGPNDWSRTLENLLRDSGSDRTATLVLGLRVQLTNQQGAVHPTAWRSAISSWCTDNGMGNDTYQSLLGVAGRILEYEARMVQDGLLAPGGFVRSMLAYDFGRAVNMARWGVNAQYVDPRSAEPYIVRAGAQSMRFYASWAELSAGYVLGRCLRFDDGEFGRTYTGPVEAHHALMSDPRSPWLNLPFRM